MNKKIVVFFVFTLMITSALTAMGTFQNNILNTETFGKTNFDGYELDQYQNISDTILGSLDPPEWYAQSFIPIKNVISKIEIFVSRQRLPDRIYIGIRNKLTDEDLVSTFKETEEIPTTPSWIEFDLKDTYIPNDETNYIVITELYEGHPGGNIYQIYGSKYDVYELGARFYSHDDGRTWEQQYGDLAFRTYGFMDIVPETPTIHGPTSGKTRIEYKYTLKAIDPDGDFVKFIIDWGDENIETTDYYPSGTNVIVKHTWSYNKIFTINVTALDIYNAKSESVTLPIEIPRNKMSFDSFFQGFLKKFPILQEIIQFIR
jgi:hypothetical protein